MTTTRRAATVVAVLLIVAAAVFMFLRRGSDAPQLAVPTTTTATPATTTTATHATVAEPDESVTTTSTVIATTTATVPEPDQPTTTTSTVTTTTTATVTDPDEPAPTTTTPTTTVPVVTVPMPEPVDWWTYNQELEWPVTDRDRLSTELVYPRDVISDAVQVAQQVEGFWSWYMTEGHPQGAALDLSGHDGLVGDAVGQLMFVHHRFWQQRLPVWWDVWNREFAKAREAQRNKLIYLDSLGELNRLVGSAGSPTLLYNPADESSVWRYWGPIVRPVPNPTAPRRSGTRRLPDDIRGGCGPLPEGVRVIEAAVSWDCVHLGPEEETALGEWDVSWYYDIPHEHAAWYVWTADGLVRYDPDVHGAPTSRYFTPSPSAVADGRLTYLPATVADGAVWADVLEELKPYRPEGFPDDPDAYRQMWRHDVGGNSSWHKEMGQLVLLVPAAQLVAWLEANGYDPQDMFAQGWPNPDEERLIRNTWAKDWDRDNPADWRNKFRDAVGWLEQGVEIGDGGNLAADIEAAIHISAWLDWAYRSRLSGAAFPTSRLSSWWNPSVVAPGLTYGASPREMAEATFGHREDGWATDGGIWWGLYHQALADGYHPDARTGRLTHPALSPELAVWREWAAAGEAERWLGFQAADGSLGPAPGDTWIPWYPESMVPLEDHYVLPEHAVGHWESVVDWWPDGGLVTPVHQPDWYHAFTVAGPYVAEAGGHMFETCLWATGGLFAAWSLPHPELEDASQNVTWIVRGIADREGRIITLAEPVNRPCINTSNPQQREGSVWLSYPDWPTYMEYVRTPIPDHMIWAGYDPATGLWTTDRSSRVAVPSQLLADGDITVHELMWFRSVATAGPNPSRDGSDGVLKPSYEDWQQWEADALIRSRWVILTWSHDWRLRIIPNAIENARADYRERGRLPLEHHGWIMMSDWETLRQVWAEGAADAFNDLIGGAELDTPARYGDWLLGSPRSYPEEFIRSTYQLISDERLRQPGGMHWLYNDGTAVDVSDWALPTSEWDRWAARSGAGTLHTGVVITPQFARRSETDRTIPAGHIGSVYGASRAVHNDWSWAYVEMPTGSPDAAPWTVYLTTCLEEGIPALTTNGGWSQHLPTGFVPEASDTPVWAWPGPLSDPYTNNLGYRSRADWPRWTWANHPNNNLASSQGNKLPPADCAGIAAGRYTPDYIYPAPGTGDYPDWMSALGPRPPEVWFATDRPFDE